VNEPGSHATAETAYAEVFTVIHDLAEGRDLAWVRGSIWPPVGTVVELPNRHALVVGIRLVLAAGERALVRVDVQDPGAGEFIARDAATRLIEDELTSEHAEAITVDVPAAPAAE
jgi:hypothetical protein